jgi:hypothetical protein
MSASEASRDVLSQVRRAIDARRLSGARVEALLLGGLLLFVDAEIATEREVGTGAG